ncbi:hypothetical protein VaNZ11_000490 [Volvox africanus]|uniref:F-box domain-containing protein n=1 Tax=Volvox africanus TaxID=51714 RepID=A0ABQ5RMT4_9CHLO|nr:hypothetical protein VaNZ11_000490 [Volvox africanus]
MAGEALTNCSQQMATWVQNRRNFALGVSSVALFVVLGAIQRARRRGRRANGRRSQGRLGHKSGASVEQHREPCTCPILWEQIQQRDWLFGLPPQIADSILARLDIQDLKALRATCRQTYLQVAARTTKLVRALDAAPRTWRLLASPRLDSIYPGLRELHLILTGDQRDGGQADLDVAGQGFRDGVGRRASRAAAAIAATTGAAAASRAQLSAANGSCGSSLGPASGHDRGPEYLRNFVSWSANGHLHGLTLLDLSRCGQVSIHQDTWTELVEALGLGEVTLRVDWRALLHHASSEATGPDVAAVGGAGGSTTGRGFSRRGGGGAAAAAAAAVAKAKAAAGGPLTSPISPEAGAGSSASALPPLPPAPRCSCSICGPSPPDATPVLSALHVLAKLRPCCSVELAGRGLPVRSPAVLQQLCAVSQVASVSIAVCGVRPLAHHAGWFSCLRRLHTLELRYREETSGDVALHQIIRALQAPVPLRSLVLHRPTTHPLDEADLAALTQLSGLSSLDAPGLRVHTPTSLVMASITRLALRSDRLELTQPLVALFPSLEHLELGHGARDLPPTPVLAAAATVMGPLGAGASAPLRNPLAAEPAGPVAAVDEVMPVAVFPGVGAAGLVLADELVLPAAGQHHLQAQPQLQHQPVQSLLPQELTLHLRLLQGLSGLRVLSIGGKPGHGVEALSSLTALSSLILVRSSEFRPLRKAVEELRGLTQLRSLELHACLGGDACGYEIARLLRRLQKLPNLSRLVVHGCDPRLPQQLATAPLARLAELQLLGLPELQPLDLRYVVQAQTGCRRLVVRGCGRLERQMVEALPTATHRPLLAVEWAS